MLDEGFKAHECCFFHPLSNEVTISLNTRDLDKFLISIGRNPMYVDLEATPLVGKDQSPDLAALLPSEAPSVVGPTANTVQNQALVGNHAPMVNKLGKCSDETTSEPNSTKVAKEKTLGTAKNRVAATDVRKFIGEIIDKTCAAVLTEISKDTEDQLKVHASLLEKVSKHIGPDMENIAMSFKNAAYTDGFHAGLYSVIDRGLQGLSSRR